MAGEGEGSVLRERLGPLRPATLAETKRGRQDSSAPLARLAETVSAVAGTKKLHPDRG